MLEQVVQEAWEGIWEEDNESGADPGETDVLAEFPLFLFLYMATNMVDGVWYDFGRIIHPLLFRTGWTGATHRRRRAHARRFGHDL